jgi:hypothetical protein
MLELRFVPVLFAFCMAVFVSLCAWAGPPFQTDDPEPIGFRNYEFYTFAASDGTRIATSTAGPAVEFNWGALPDVHLHLIVPAAAIFQRTGPTAFGMGDLEAGIKFRFVRESKYRPQVGTFTMFEIPTGSSARGLGVGKAWYKVPIWAQKSFGPWTTYGGGGATIVKGVPGLRTFPYAGWLVEREWGKQITLGGELFYHGSEGDAAPQTKSTVLLDVGGYYKFRDPGFQLLFCYGHAIAGQVETYAYLGLYWTWGYHDKDGGGDSSVRPNPPAPFFGYGRE